MSRGVPGIWSGPVWALQSGLTGGGVSRAGLVWRAVAASVLHPRVMRRWMAVLAELHGRGIVIDLPAEYLRAVRPYVHRNTGTGTRVVQLVDHLDWMETAFMPAAFDMLVAGEAVVLADLPAPRGCDFMRLQLRRAPPQSPEGELLLSLTLQRSADVQQKAVPVDASVLALSRFRIDDVACLVIGGVRGQRTQLRLSPNEIGQALSGWKPAVMMVRVAQELARHWGLSLVGLDPASHRLQGWTWQLSKRHRDTSLRIYSSYDALWEHFHATKGPPGWVILPLNSDEKLEATALSPERRARQITRADYWLRVRNLLRARLRDVLQRPDREARLSRLTESQTIAGMQEGGEFDFQNSEDMVPSRVLETGPGSLL